MAYRGEPGRIGVTTKHGWTIGHTRLAIQDLTDKAAQPFESAHQTFAFVGEVFNRAKWPGWAESSIIQEAIFYRNFHRIDGFWAAVNVTPTGAEAFTDHLGIKPLYWWPEHGIICSELEPMFALEPRPPLDEVYLSNCIKFGYDYSGRTPYMGIRQVAPGTRVDLSEGRTSVHWDWTQLPSSGKLQKLVTRAVENRLVGDRPVALLLSGGLDSSIIYYTLKALGREVEAFSIENGESEYLPEGVLPLKLKEFDLREAVRIMQAPLDLGSLIPQIQLAEAVAATGYNVVLTGDGADELFGGYRRSMEYDSQGSDVFCELPYYHLPRLDRVMMHKTIELRSPFLAPAIVKYALGLHHFVRKDKIWLKDNFRGFVPARIIDRPKHPLKTKAVIEGGIQYRANLVEEFKRYVLSDF